MACLPVQTPYTHTQSHIHHHHTTWGFHPKFPIPTTSNLSSPPPPFFFPSSSNGGRLFSGSLPIHSRSFHRCRAVAPGPPPDDEPPQIGMMATFGRLWDMLQIFIAVFFWMSLFFWASASDRNNTIKGNKRR